jgi:hypothetical protein
LNTSSYSSKVCSSHVRVDSTKRPRLTLLSLVASARLVAELGGFAHRSLRPRKAGLREEANSLVSSRPQISLMRECSPWLLSSCFSLYCWKMCTLEGCQLCHIGQKMPQHSKATNKTKQCWQLVGGSMDSGLAERRGSYGTERGNTVLLCIKTARERMFASAFQSPFLSMLPSLHLYVT